MDVLASESPMTREITRRRLLQAKPLTLIDVGCSGGLHRAWRAFGEDLRGVGVDAMVDECERLRAMESNPNVKYRAAIMGLPESHPFVTQRGSRPCVPTGLAERLSTVAAVHSLQKTLNRAEHREKLNAWHEETLASEQKLTMKQLLDEHGLDSVDFIKIDVDGADLDILVSCEAIFASAQVLGMQLEVLYVGSDAATDHTFHNMDRLMRRNGFALYGLTVRHYSHTALPSRFCYEVPGPTQFGPPLQGDAWYLRDLADPANEKLAREFGPSKLLKLACLCELGRVPDCAAEVLNRFASELESITDLESLRDLLVPQRSGESRLRYRDYVESFRRDVGSFLARPTPVRRRSFITRTLGFIGRRFAPHAKGST